MNPIFTAEYDEPAARYHQEVAARKRQALSSKIIDELHNLFSKQLQRIAEVTCSLYNLTYHEKSTAFFESLLKEVLPTDGTAVTEFAKLKRSVLTSTYEYYEQRAKGTPLKFIFFEKHASLPRA